jgi:hypothetical protein
MMIGIFVGTPSRSVRHQPIPKIYIAHLDIWQWYQGETHLFWGKVSVGGEFEARNRSRVRLTVCEILDLGFVLIFAFSVEGFIAFLTSLIH